jgi:hypothetical protein
MPNCAADMPPHMPGTLSEGMRCRPAVLAAGRHSIIFKIGTFNAELQMRSTLLLRYSAAKCAAWHN